MTTITERILSGIKQTWKLAIKSKLTARGICYHWFRIECRWSHSPLMKHSLHCVMQTLSVRAHETSKYPEIPLFSFVAKTGNAANSTNPWGYTVSPNSGSPNIDTSIWQLPTRVISAQLPVRSAVLTDVNGLQNELVEDLMMEFAQA